MALALIGEERLSKAEVHHAEAELARGGPAGEVSKEEHAQKMRQLRKISGNSLLLSAVLLHNKNFFSARLLHACGHLLWLEQAFKNKEKKTPWQDMDYECRLAHGAGEAFLKGVWRHVVQDRELLARLGVSVAGGPCQSFAPETDPISGVPLPGVPPDAIPGRIMDFLLAVVAARLWSYSWHECAYPNGFAGLCSRDPAEVASALLRARETWDLVGAATQPDQPVGLQQLRKAAFFLDWPSCQLRFRILAHVGFQPHAGVLQWFTRSFLRVGDTLVNEKCNKVGRRTEQHSQESNAVSTSAVFHAVRRPAESIFSSRGIPEVVLQPEDWQERRALFLEGLGRQFARRPFRDYVAWQFSVVRQASRPQCTAKTWQSRTAGRVELPEKLGCDTLLSSKKPYPSLGST